MSLPTLPPYQPQFNYPNNKLYQYEAYPVLINCNFVVDASNGNGLGIRNLKGNGVANVFMHTSSTPGVGNYGATNPNPSTGIIILKLQNNFSRVLQSGFSIVSPLTGSQLTAVTSGTTYVITSLGTATVAQWTAVGLPAEFTPAVGAAFQATSSATIGGSATVQVQGVSGITSIEGVGDPNALLQSSAIYSHGGGLIRMQCLGPTSSSSTIPIPTAPAQNTVIGLSFLFSNSSISVNGQ